MRWVRSCQRPRQVTSGRFEPMQIGGYRQLFVDEHIVERCVN